MTCNKGFLAKVKSGIFWDMVSFMKHYSELQLLVSCQAATLLFWFALNALMPSFSAAVLSEKATSW